jgi:hypothetical protein
MSTTLLVVVGALAILAIVLVVYKVIKAAVFCGIAAVVIYVGYQYVLPFWETHIAPLAGFLS